VKLLRASLNKQWTLVSAQEFDMNRTVQKVIWEQNGVSTEDSGSWLVSRLAKGSAWSVCRIENPDDEKVRVHILICMSTNRHWICLTDIHKPNTGTHT